VPQALEMHDFAGSTNSSSFVWFRPLPTTASTEQATSAALHGNSNPIPYNQGLPLWATILIIVGIFLVIVAIVALIISLIVRHRKKKRKDSGNFY